ncbi:hypothetical protein DNTS_035732 [Danionella cerebrum]|uniref:Uncharacterized protein n=1 Tax=Danionella cerebrum TaxID=2873325 RepID=A0A553RGE1_9TELE|nr:hypothetical protein DNTS_035732 [Danionella translucida]
MSCVCAPRKRTKEEELIHQETRKNVAHENSKRIEKKSERFPLQPGAVKSQRSGGGEVVVAKLVLFRESLEGDPDLQFLLRGGDLIKVKSSSWKKTRLFRLNDDCKTMWQETSKAFKKDTSCKLHHTISARGRTVEQC